jgi:GDP-L-fucose synthase
MPTNLYGKGDNYHPENSHVIPALLRRFHEAKLNTAPEVIVWGTGKPRREFLHVDDLAKGCLHLLEQDSPPDWVNIGSGSDLEIGELAQLVAETVGFEGKIVFDTTKPDGTPRKLMDISRLKGLGWAPQIDLASGLRDAYADFLKSLDAGAVRAA